MGTEEPRRRVLCSSTGGAGHIAPLAPVAVALRDAGHDVRWAIGADSGPSVAAMGFEWTAAGLTNAERRDAAQAAIAEAMGLPIADRRGVLFRGFFAEVTARVMHTDLGPILDEWRPDVVLREVAELAAAAMAAPRGIPLVTVAFSGVLPPHARPTVLEALRPLWAAEGRRDPTWSDLNGDLYLHPFPPSFGQAPDRSTPTRALRPTSQPPPGDPPPWLASLGDRPALYVTAGTEPPSTMFPWPLIVAAAGRRAIDAVITTGPHVDPAGLGPLPSNVRVERFVPQAWVLPRVSAVISHGGAGSVLGAAAAGRPQLAVPMFADQWEHGQAVATADCGAVLAPEHRDADAIDAAVHELLTSSQRRAAAATVADEIAAMSTPADVVPAIEAVVGG